MGYRVAVVGATGNVGREILQILAERAFPVDDVVALASERSIGKQVSFGDTDILKAANLADFDFRNTDIVLSSPGASVSAVHSPRAAKAGAVVIDNTSYFRMDPDVPLVIAERLKGQLRSADVQLQVVKGGGHRLSEPHEIATIIDAVDGLLETL